MSPGSHPLILLRGLTIIQTQRPVENGTPDGNRTHISRIESGRSIAVELRGDQMGKWRDRAEALHAGNRTRTATAFAETVRPPYGGG